MDKKQKLYPLLVLGSYFLTVHLLYASNYDAGMVTDFSGLVQKLEEGSAIDILNSFGFPSVQPFLNLIYYIHYQVFDLNPFSWYFLFTSLFILNAWLLFHFTKKLCSIFEIENSSAIAFWSGFIFLIIPYQSEVVVWKVSLSYHLVFALSLFLLIWFLSWVKAPKSKIWWTIQIVFLLALFTFELAYSIPFIVVLLWLTIPKTNTHLVSSSIFFKKIAAPLFIQLGTYFLATKMIIGSWIGHYGASVHLAADPMLLISNVFRYFFKYLFLGRYLPQDWKNFLFQDINHLLFLVPATILLGLSISLILIKWDRIKDQFKLSLLLIAMFFLSLVPILSLYFNDLLFIENDRYGYLASAFFCIAFVNLLFVLAKPFKYGFLLIYCIACIGLTWKTNQYWKDSTKVYRSLIETFDFKQYEHVFILNLPDNFYGADLFRDYSGQDRAFADALKYIARKHHQANVHEIVQYNLTSLDNRILVEQVDSMQLKVTFQQYGNWWWRRGLGATNYENEWYRYENRGMHYLLHLKQIPQNAIFIYQEGTEWKEWSLE